MTKKCQKWLKETDRLIANSLLRASQENNTKSMNKRLKSRKYKFHRQKAKFRN